MDSRFELVSGNIRLYRPVGQAELDLVEASGWKEWPPRLLGQPFFYPTVNKPYAARIAREWNTKDPASGYIGYVTEFDVTPEVAERYPVQIAGGSECIELWVPAEELGWFNERIVGQIRVVETFRPEETA